MQLFILCEESAEKTLFADTFSGIGSVSFVASVKPDADRPMVHVEYEVNPADRRKIANNLAGNKKVTSWSFR